MSLSGRWSLFSRAVKEEKQEDGKSEFNDRNGNDRNGNDRNGNENESEIVLSSSKEEEVVVKDKMVVETSCNTESTESVDMYEKLNEYLNMRFVTSDSHEHEDKDYNDNTDYNGNNSNSHYKGLHTEVMPTMPVLYIEEFVSPPPYSSKVKLSVTDWRAYIYYDLYRGVYVLNGTRRRSNEHGAGIERKFPDIRMTFKSKSSLAFYLRKSMCSWKHKLSVTLYSMYRSVIHLSTVGAMPSFHSIHHCRTKFRTELFGYDDCHVSLKEFDSYLKVLKESEDDGFLFRPTTNTI